MNIPFSIDEIKRNVDKVCASFYLPRFLKHSELSTLLIHLLCIIRKFQESCDIEIENMLET